MKDELWMAFFAIAILLFSYWYSDESCKARGVSFDDVEFTLVGGCMVRHQGKWLPLDNIRGFDGN